MKSDTKNTTQLTPTARTSDPTMVSALATRSLWDDLACCVPQQPVLGGGSDEKDGGKGHRQQRSEVDVFLVGLERRKALREDDRKKEGEQYLHARQNNPQLLQELVHLAGASLSLRTSVGILIHPYSIS